MESGVPKNIHWKVKEQWKAMESNERLVCFSFYSSIALQCWLSAPAGTSFVSIDEVQREPSIQLNFTG